MKKLISDEKPAHSLFVGLRKHNCTSIVVKQHGIEWDAVVARRNRNAAFEEWRQRLNPGDRLPRGRFFIGKKPGRKPLLIDEFWSIKG